MLNDYNVLNSNRMRCSGLKLKLKFCWPPNYLQADGYCPFLCNIEPASKSVLSNCIKFRIIGLHQIPYYGSASKSESSTLADIGCCCIKYHQQAPRTRWCKQGLDITGTRVEQNYFPIWKGLKAQRRVR